jgi:hypothetical protein
MKKLVVGATALVLAGTALGAGATPQRRLPLTVLGGGEIATYMGGFGNESHPSHPSLLVVSTKKGATRLMLLVKPEDQERLGQVDFRRSIVVAAFVDYNAMPDLCREHLTLRRLGLVNHRIYAKATVEAVTNCATIPEVTGAHLYSLGTFPRHLAAKIPKPGYLAVRDVPES